jgi:EmrB/QacA subfamily drug resistance transporter
VKRLHGNPWAVLVTLCLGFFMILLDTSIVNIAIPDMIDALHASFDQVLWIVNAYTLVFAVGLLLAGRLGDMFGRRRIFVTGLVVFTVASAACGAAAGPGQLIAARAVQGLGATLLMPQTLAILTAVFPPQRRGAAFGIWSAVGGVAPVAGPVVGGLLVNAASWRWIFLINIPVGLITIVLALRWIPSTQQRRHNTLDIAGVLLSTFGLSFVVFGLIEGQRYNWGHVRSFVSIPLILAVGIALLAVFLIHQWRRRDDEPLLPLRIFANSDFATMAFVACAVLFAVTSLLLPLTVYLQSVLGMSALAAGFVLAPPSVVQFILAPIAGKLSDRIGGKYILFGGLILFGAGFGLLALVAKPDSHWYQLMPSLLLAGAGMGAVFAPMNAMAMRKVSPQFAGAGSSVVSLARQLGAVLGGAAIGALLQTEVSDKLSSTAAARSAELPPDLRGPLVQGFEQASQGGLRLGTGQAGGVVPTPNGISGDLATRFHQVASEVFTNGFVAALRPTLVLPVAVLLVAALACLLLRESRPAPAPSDADRPLSDAPATVPVGDHPAPTRNR